MSSESGSKLILNCPDCEKTYKRLANLEKHQIQFHNRKMPVNTSLKGKAKRVGKRLKVNSNEGSKSRKVGKTSKVVEKPFKCQFCHRAFGCKSWRTYHQRQAHEPG